jgi:hypothetical protein
VARIWQTVDVDRTVADLALPAEPIADDEVLGARGVLVRPPGTAARDRRAVHGGSARGRARASRRGRRGHYVAPAGGTPTTHAARAPDHRGGPGPFGRSTLVAPPGADRWSPFLVIVASPPATIER